MGDGDANNTVQHRAQGQERGIGQEAECPYARPRNRMKDAWDRTLWDEPTVGQLTCSWPQEREVDSPSPGKPPSQARSAKPQPTLRIISNINVIAECCWDFVAICYLAFLWQELADTQGYKKVLSHKGQRSIGGVGKCLPATEVKRKE